MVPPFPFHLRFTELGQKNKHISSLKGRKVFFRGTTQIGSIKRPLLIQKYGNNNIIQYLFLIPPSF